MNWFLNLSPQIWKVYMLVSRKRERQQRPFAVPPAATAPTVVVCSDHIPTPETPRHGLMSINTLQMRLLQSGDVGLVIGYNCPQGGD